MVISFTETFLYIKEHVITFAWYALLLSTCTPLFVIAIVTLLSDYESAIDIIQSALLGFFLICMIIFSFCAIDINGCLLLWYHSVCSWDFVFVVFHIYRCIYIYASEYSKKTFTQEMFSWNV